jgi:hypothetical protein
MLFPGYREPFPSNDVIVDKHGRPTDQLTDWVELGLERALQAAPIRLQPTEVLTDVSASDSGTLGGDETAGFYRVSGYREVTVADPVSSSLTLTIGWTHNSKALTRTFNFGAAPQTVNDTDGVVTVVQIDPGTVISYTLTYLSNTPAMARFDVTLSAELIQSLE